MGRIHGVAAVVLASVAGTTLSVGAEEGATRQAPAGKVTPATELARRTLEAKTTAALEHFQAGRYAEAQALFDEVLAGGLERADRDTLAFNAAVCAYALGAYADAQRRFESVAATWPKLASLARANAGRAALRAGDVAAARRHAATPPGTDPEAQRAHALLAREIHDVEASVSSGRKEPTPQEIGEATAALSTLYGLPSGMFLLAATTTGFDSNADQSGTTEVTGTGASGGTGSWFQSALVDAGYAFRTSRRTSLGPYYNGDAVFLLHGAVQSLSLQVHELGARFDYAPHTSTLLRFEAGGASVLSGIDPVSTFAWEGVVNTRAEVTTSAHSAARLMLSVRATSATELDYLSGTRIDTGLGERWQVDAWQFGADTFARYNAVGVAETRLDPESSICVPQAQCNGNGGGPPYFIPLSYFGTGGGVSVSWNALERLRFSLRGTLEWRRYTGESGRANERRTQRFREDWRFRARMGAELALDKAKRFWLTFEDTLLTSSSNIAFDPNDPVHALDYANRNFVQNVAELGIQVIL